ncbi:DUF3616 domain-containing protein [Adhaeribacter rhizoryzae]|uniref:DUF3616 domain-containing protein n=1 Tax=Adhaeribacter rhizoryzae TaxID=2607907 RepID=A0A5M6DDW3_9BACT|nr:DUF3616 domain-containing protein [Adhaeribacter rhizoryzae]KAA5545751.1 DUF3616 domain-containing protein [Adhaeribacter rhizoryzae]
MRKKDIKLLFDNNISFNEAGKHVRDGLSAAFRTGDNLWLSCDERSSLERLKLTDAGSFGEHQSIDLNKYLKLPAGGDCEVDIEGLGHGNHYLWLVGSHSLARKKPRKEDSPAKQIKRLAKIKDDPNRYLLARIPIILNEETGNYELYKSCPHPKHPDKILTAAQLVMHKKGNQLMDAIADDIHFKDFLKIPGKDNGFDIEGLAVSGDRIFLGIRGPVLRGWAAILELEVKDTEDGYFELKPDKQNRLYKKHFLHLEGMGVRELRVSGNDLLLLAGPTMDLDGTIAVYRWPNALLQEDEAIVHRKDLERLIDVPHGSGPTTGKDKAEGMALYDEKHVLIVHDSPTDDRKIGDNGVIADLYTL